MENKITTPTPPTPDYAPELINDYYRLSKNIIDRALQRGTCLWPYESTHLRNLSNAIRHMQHGIKPAEEKDTLVVIRPKLTWPPEDK